MLRTIVEIGQTSEMPGKTPIVHGIRTKYHISGFVWANSNYNQHNFGKTVATNYNENNRFFIIYSYLRYNKYYSK